MGLTVSLIDVKDNIAAVRKELEAERALMQEELGQFSELTWTQLVRLHIQTSENVKRMEAELKQLRRDLREKKDVRERKRGRG